MRERFGERHIYKENPARISRTHNTLGSTNMLGTFPARARQDSMRNSSLFVFCENFRIISSGIGNIPDLPEKNTNFANAFGRNSEIAEEQRLSIIQF